MLPSAITKSKKKKIKKLNSTRAAWQKSRVEEREEKIFSIITTKMHPSQRSNKRKASITQLVEYLKREFLHITHYFTSLILYTYVYSICSEAMVMFKLVVVNEWTNYKVKGYSYESLSASGRILYKRWSPDFWYSFLAGPWPELD